MRMREWIDIHKQLTRQLTYNKLEQSKSNHEAIHRALLTGLLSHIGLHDEGLVVLGEIVVHPLRQ